MFCVQFNKCVQRKTRSASLDKYSLPLTGTNFRKQFRNFAGVKLWNDEIPEKVKTESTLRAFLKEIQVLSVEQINIIDVGSSGITNINILSSWYTANKICTWQPIWIINCPSAFHCDYENCNASFKYTQWSCPKHVMIVLLPTQSHLTIRNYLSCHIHMFFSCFHLYFAIIMLYFKNQNGCKSFHN